MPELNEEKAVGKPVHGKTSEKTDVSPQENDISGLTQSEREHRTYLMVCEKFREYEIKRLHYRRYGTLFIIISALVFLTLMFSLESKVTFLILWIITIVLCVALMLRTDYMYNMYYEMLDGFIPGEESRNEAPSEQTETRTRKE